MKIRLTKGNILILHVHAAAALPKFVYLEWNRRRYSTGGASYEVE